MNITLTLPAALSEKLTRRAQTQRQSVEDLALTLLDESLEQSDSQRELEELVARIKALPPNPANQFDMKSSMKGLAEYLAESIAAEDPNEEFDQEEWQRQWDAIEAEMKAIDRANDVAEGLI